MMNLGKLGESVSERWRQADHVSLSHPDTGYLGCGEDVHLTKVSFQVDPHCTWKSMQTAITKDLLCRRAKKSAINTKLTGNLSTL